MKLLLTLSAIASLVAAMTFGYLGHADLLVSGMLACLAFLVVANLDRVSEFKASAGGIEARTRDVVNRAEGAIAELRILALHIAEISLSLAMRTGRWGGFADEELSRISSSVIENLERLGIPEEQRQLAFKDWHRMVEFDYAHLILGGSRIPEQAPQQVMQEWNRLREGGVAKVPTPDELESFLRSSGYLNATRADYVEDYRFYIRQRQHRRPQVWQEREHWGHLRNDA